MTNWTGLDWSGLDWTGLDWTGRFLYLGLNSRFCQQNPMWDEFALIKPNHQKMNGLGSYGLDQ